MIKNNENKLDIDYQNKMKLPAFLTTVTPFSKLLALFLFILLPIIGFFLGMWYQKIVLLNDVQFRQELRQLTPTISPTQIDNISNWKTYTDSNNKYYLSYPSDWQVKQTSIGSIVIISPDYLSHPTSGIIEKGATLIIWPDHNSPITSMDFSIESQQKMSISSLDGVIYEVSGAGIDGKAYIASVTNKGINYTFDFYYEQSRKQELEQIFKQILSAFRFLDENQMQPKLTSSKDVEAFCKQNGGTFLYELNEQNKYMECENIDEQICKQNGGIFDECASSCRHDPSAEVCIELCVPVCSF